MSETPQFTVRGVEIHTRHMWEWEHVRRVLEFATETRLNALVFHQNDLVDQVVYPERFLSRELMKKGFPVYMHSTENNRYYIRKVAQTARERGIDFFLEVKELWYRTYLLRMYPELMRAGAVCPNHPFWWEYLPAKLESLFAQIPELSGVIVSLASKESRLSLRNTRCECDTCRQTPADTWYRQVIAAMYGPTRAAGKTLVVRDFVWSPKDLDEVVSAVESSPPDIVISLKNTPHDYYPNFPHNPRIGHAGNHAQWIEYDVWGQFYGWGVFPCILLEDIRRRLAYALAQGATGFIARTDWESISEGSAIDSVNKLNLYGTAMLSYDLATDLQEIYQAWLRHPVSTAFSASDVATAPGIDGDPARVDLAPLQAILQATWPVMERGIYLGGCVFHEDSMFPIALDDAWWIMQGNHSLADWDPTKASVLDMTPENVRALLAGKVEALAMIRRLGEQLREDGNRMGLAPWFYADLVTSFEMYVRYVEGFYHAARGCVLTKYYLATMAEPVRVDAAQAIKGLEEYAGHLRKAVSRTKVPHYAYMLLDPDRLGALAADLRGKIGQAVERP